MILSTILFVWIVSTLFESWHDWHLHCKLYKPNARPADKDTLKSLDGAEKAVFLTGLSMWVWQSSYDPLLTGLVIVWQAWLRWLGHEAWYSWFSRSQFGSMGKSSVFDGAINALSLGRWGNVALMVIPATVLTVMVFTIAGGAGFAP